MQGEAGGAQGVTRESSREEADEAVEAREQVLGGDEGEVTCLRWSGGGGV